MKTIRTTRLATDSHWFIINGQNCFLPWNWGVKVDMENMTYLTYGDPEYKTSDLPTLNDLKWKMGVSVEEGKPYEEYEIDFPDSVRVLTPDMAQEVVREFNEHGFPVTMESVMHNYAAWNTDFKSGYRGEGFHLFTPCGCNRLSFRATTLHPSCDSWQTTYMC